MFLQRYEIKSHIAGDLNADVFFEQDSIAFTGINRAKGNEVGMVYIINADFCYEGWELRKRRNILFTAITRSKAWVRICGIGPKMERLRDEFAQARENDFSLVFRYPTKEQIDAMNTINRDMTNDEKQAIKGDVAALNEMLARIRSGKAYLEDYPEEVQELLANLIKNRK